MDAKTYYNLSKNTEQKYGEDSRQWNIFPLGIVGELGTLASVIKKHVRDKDAYINYKENLIEEVGDILWYLLAIARRLDSPISKWPSKKSTAKSVEDSIYQLTSLVQNITELCNRIKNGENQDTIDIAILLEQSLIELQYISYTVDENLEEVASKSISKTESLWKGDVNTPARCFDNDEMYEEYEKLPRVFVVEFIEIKKKANTNNKQDAKDNNELIIRMNDVQLGDRLTDNSWEIDGYRYHDIFHMAGAALLGWSPVFRRMLKKKRKSNKKVDEREDGARAAIIEEAIVSQIYDYGESHDFSDRIISIDIDVIKNICRMVRNYEAKVIQPWEWRHCMLSSYKIFNEIRWGFSGKIQFDAEKRKISVIENYSN